MKESQLEKIGFMTRRFNPFQGLRCTVPVGVLILFQGLPGVLGPNVVSLYMSLLGVVVALCVVRWQRGGSRSYYAARVGEVEPRSWRFAPIDMGSPAGRRVIVGSVIVSLAICAVAGVALGHRPASEVRSAWVLGARAFYLLMAALFFGDWWISREHRLDQAHYVVVGAVLLAIAAHGQGFGLLDPSLGRKAFAEAELLLGSIFIVFGLIDHWRLMRAFGPPRDVASTTALG